MARFTYIPNRVIDSDGISDGANIHFYLPGTTTPASIYTDAALTIPATNPYVVAAGAAVPSLYFAETEVRVRVVDDAGATVSDDDPYEPVANGLTQARNTFGTVAALVASTNSAGGTGTIWRANTHTYIEAASGASDQDLTTAGGVKLYVQPDVNGFNVKAFNAKGDGSTNDTTAIQTAINRAASDGSRVVYFPSGRYIVTTLYDHYNAVNNPDFPNGAHLNGRLRLVGERACDLTQLTNGLYEGVVIETTSATGPALKLGNGNSADATTARRPHIANIAFLGTCTGSVLELDGAAQHAMLENLTVFNAGGASGKALYIHNGFYTSTLRNIHIRSDGTSGDGLVCETASLCLFDTVNVTNCLGHALDLGLAPSSEDDPQLGQSNVFLNCQFRNGTDGVRVNGGINLKFTSCWFEQNDGDYDFFANGDCTKLDLELCHFTSTELNVAAAIIGGNSGTAYLDRVRNATIRNCSFDFCGPTATQSGVLKRGSCQSLKVLDCSLKNNGGKGIKIDTTLGVTPTIISQLDFDPIGASSVIPVGSRIVDESGARAEHLVRGHNEAYGISAGVASTAITGAANNGSGLIRITSTAHGLTTGNFVHIENVGGTTEANGEWEVTVIDANNFDLVGSSFSNAYTSGGNVTRYALDMRAWSHLPDHIRGTSSGGDIYIALPDPTAVEAGLEFSVQKNLGSNTLGVYYSSINDSSGAVSSPVELSADEAIAMFRTMGAGRYGRIA